jgi:hypothetical protein
MVPSQSTPITNDSSGIPAGGRAEEVAQGHRRSASRRSRYSHEITQAWFDILAARLGVNMYNRTTLGRF